MLSSGYAYAMQFSLMNGIAVLVRAPLSSFFPRASTVPFRSNLSEYLIRTNTFFLFNISNLRTALWRNIYPFQKYISHFDWRKKNVADMTGTK